MFVPIKNVKPDYVALVDRFQSEGSSPIPKYSSQAVSGLLAAIMKSQTDVAAEGYETYGDYIRAISAEYHSNVNAFNEQKTSTADVNRIKRSTTSIDKFDGIS